MPPRWADQAQLDDSNSNSNKENTKTLLNDHEFPFSTSHRRRKRMPENCLCSRENVTVQLSVRDEPGCVTTSYVRRFRRHCWGLHFALSLAVLFWGISSNQGTRKFVPIEGSSVNSTCQKAFLNSMALTADTADSTICCDPPTSDLAMDVCAKSSLPFANRLNRFPQAWLVPLLPWFLGWIFSYFDTTKTSSSQKHRWRRLLVYVCIMIFRGVVLYQALNYVEDHYFVQALHDDDSSCWYQSWLRQDQATCYGRIFDFSDHAVLYFAQLLPVALTEALIQWRGTSRSWSSSSHKYNGKYQRIGLVLVVAYLYWIVLAGAYKTGAYFHTGSEMVAGFVVSLVIQGPLCYFQCRPRDESKWYSSWFEGH